jgi:hypothetical protein
MSEIRTLALAGVLVVLYGCGSADQAEPSQAEPEAPAASAEEEGVFDPMVGAIDRAKSVEEVGASRKAEMDRRLEQAE